MGVKRVVPRGPLGIEEMTRGRHHHPRDPLPGRHPDQDMAGGFGLHHQLVGSVLIPDPHHQPPTISKTLSWTPKSRTPTDEWHGVGDN